MRVVAVDDGVTFRTGLPVERWPQPAVAIVEPAFSRPRAFHSEQRKQEQKQRALAYVFQHRGMT